MNLENFELFKMRKLCGRRTFKRDSRYCMRAHASEVRQKPIVSPHFFPRFVPATGVCLESFDWLGVLQKNCRVKGTIATFELRKKKSIS